MKYYQVDMQTNDYKYGHRFYPISITGNPTSIFKQYLITAFLEKVNAHIPVSNTPDHTKYTVDEVIYTHKEIEKSEYDFTHPNQITFN